jgi:CRP-like cAMP-binding protein
VAREGATAKAFYLIQSGHVEIETQDNAGERRVVQRIGPGEVVGWSWLLSPHHWQFDCRAVDTVQGVAFDAEWLRNQCEQDHELGYHLLRHLLAVVAGRLAASRRAKSQEHAQSEALVTG